MNDELNLNALPASGPKSGEATANPLYVKTFLVLMLILTVLGGVSVFMPLGPFEALLKDQELPPKPVLALGTAGILLVVYGPLGLVGLLLARKLGFAGLWNPSVSNRQRFLVPAIAGVAIGVFFIVADMVFSRCHPLGAFPHPPFPTSLVASATAGIGEEIIFRLFFVSFWVWLISQVILRNRWQGAVFWIVVACSAVAFSVGHIPGVMVLLGVEAPGEIPVAVWIEVLLLNGVLSFVAAYYFRKYGFLAAVGVHFWVDVIWHVLWGAMC